MKSLQSYKKISDSGKKAADNFFFFQRRRMNAADRKAS